MKKRDLWLLFSAAAVVVTVAVLWRTEKRSTDTRLQRVSDEGYETAFDVLYPDRRRAGRKQHYGPVI